MPLLCILNTSISQALQSELRSCQQKQAAQQLSYESTVAVLQADLAALRSRVDDVQSNTQAAADQLRASVRLQIEQHRTEADEQLQVCLQLPCGPSSRITGSKAQVDRNTQQQQSAQDQCVCRIICALSKSD